MGHSGWINNVTEVKKTKYIWIGEQIFTSGHFQHTIIICFLIIGCAILQVPLLAENLNKRCTKKDEYLYTEAVIMIAMYGNYMKHITTKWPSISPLYIYTPYGAIYLVLNKLVTAQNNLLISDCSKLNWKE